MSEIAMKGIMEAGLVESKRGRFCQTESVEEILKGLQESTYNTEACFQRVTGLDKN